LAIEGRLNVTHPGRRRRMNGMSKRRRPGGPGGSGAARARGLVQRRDRTPSATPTHVMCPRFAVSARGPSGAGEYARVIAMPSSRRAPPPAFVGRHARLPFPIFIGPCLSSLPSRNRRIVPAGCSNLHVYSSHRLICNHCFYAYFVSMLYINARSQPGQRRKLKRDRRCTYNQSDKHKRRNCLS
jgi:hypothetical protein